MSSFTRAISLFVFALQFTVGQAHAQSAQMVAPQAAKSATEMAVIAENNGEKSAGAPNPTGSVAKTRKSKKGLAGTSTSSASNKASEYETLALTCVEQTSTGEISYALRAAQGRAEVTASVNDNQVAQVKGCLAFRLGTTRLVQCLDKNSDIPRFTQYIVTPDLNMHFIQTSVLEARGEKSLQVSPLEGTAHCKEAQL